MKRTKLAGVVALPLLALLNTAHAQESPAHPAQTHMVGTMGVTYGGDKLATVHYTNGDDTDIHAGGLLLFGLGVDHQFGNQWELQATLNYLFDTANAKNGDVTFSRWPLDVLGFYRNGSHRFGGGVTYHMNPKFDADFPGVKDKVDFDDALGAVLEYDYFFTDNFSVGVRGTLINYKSSEIRDDVNGDSIGVTLNGYFF